jgi:predicted transglutaminase-like cysteine proteinase
VHHARGGVDLAGVGRHGPSIPTQLRRLFSEKKREASQARGASRGNEKRMVNLEMVRSKMPMEAMPLAEGDAGVEQTIRQMRRLIEKGKKDPAVHECAAWILRAGRVPAFDWTGECRAIYDWVRRNIRFTRDVYGKETLHAAPEILRLGIGDCDDFTILICSLLGTIGVKTRIVTVSNRGEDPEQFSHVYPEAYVEGEGRWIPLDAARRNPAFARGPENFFRKRVWNTTSDEYVDIQGLNGPAGVGPSALPGAFRPGVDDPRLRNLSHLGLHGLGHYGVPALRRLSSGALTARRGLGDTPSWVTALPGIITSGGQEAANIIAASRAAPQNLVPSTGGFPSATISPYGATIPSTFSPSVTSGLSTGTLLLGGLLLVGVLAISRR